MAKKRKIGFTGGMGRRKRWHEVMGTPFVSGTFARMRAVRRPKESRTDFVREAVEHELRRREARKGRRRPPG